MLNSWELLTAVLGVLAGIVGLIRFYSQRVDRKDKKIEELQKQLDPELKGERDRLRVELDQLNKIVTEVKEELASERLNGQALHGRVATLEGDLKTEKEKGAQSASLAAERIKKLREWANAYEKLKQQARQHIEELTQRINELEAEGESFEARLADVLQRSMSDQRRAVEECQGQHVEVLTRYKEAVAERDKRIEKDRQNILSLRQQLLEHEEAQQTILTRKGRIWERPLSSSPDSFIPLTQRRTPIISVLNLKGGVGKTTITANLAALLGMKAAQTDSKRPLVVDLDYQRSLTQLCCKRKHLQRLHDAKRCVQHLLLHPSSEVLNQADSVQSQGSGNPLSHALRISVSPVRRGTVELFDFLACSDGEAIDDPGSSLEDTELHLLAQWLLDGTKEDIRLKLREALHSTDVLSEYSHVLLDCPPRLSVACINALAASDFVLVPVLLDETSALSLPLLFKKIQRLREHTTFLSSLRILGIVPNKVQSRNSQADMFDRLPLYAEEALGESVAIFDSLIRDRNDFGAVASGNEPEFAVCTNSEIYGWFDELSIFIEKRVEDERKNAQSVPSESGRSITGQPSIR